MPVSREIFVEITSLYYGYTKSKDGHKYLAGKRKAIKIISDSLWEQALENIFGEKPRSYTDAMRMINKRRSTLTKSDDIQVVNALYDVLADYEILNDKNYIDIAKKLLPVFVGSLKKLCVALSEHGDHSGSNRAVKLSALLDGV